MCAAHASAAAVSVWPTLGACVGACCCGCSTLAPASCAASSLPCAAAAGAGTMRVGRPSAECASALAGGLGCLHSWADQGLSGSSRRASAGVAMMGTKYPPVSELSSGHILGTGQCRKTEQELKAIACAVCRGKHLSWPLNTSRTHWSPHWRRLLHHHAGGLSPGCQAPCRPPGAALLPAAAFVGRPGLAAPHAALCSAPIPPLHTRSSLAVAGSGSTEASM